MVTGDGAGRTTPDSDVQETPETDTIAQGLAALEKRLAIELKVLLMSGPSTSIGCTALADDR